MRSLRQLISPAKGVPFNLLQTCPSQPTALTTDTDVVDAGRPPRLASRAIRPSRRHSDAPATSRSSARQRRTVPMGTKPRRRKRDLQHFTEPGIRPMPMHARLPTARVAIHVLAAHVFLNVSGKGPSRRDGDLGGSLRVRKLLCHSFTPYGSPWGRQSCPALGSTSLETGIVCGCPSWSPAGACLADNINWEQVPAGSTSAVPAPAPTTSVGDFYSLSTTRAPPAYAYPYDDNAGTLACTQRGSVGRPVVQHHLLPGRIRRNADRNADCIGNHDGNPDSHANSDSHRDTDAIQDRHANQDREAHQDGDADQDRDTDATKPRRRRPPRPRHRSRPRRQPPRQPRLQSAR